MADFWAIEIGIHHYRFLPSLSYAQRDAELLHEFLIQTGGFSARRCALITDAITVDSSSPTFPTVANIHTQVVQVCQRVKPDDLLLCFFSGYGLKFQGKDYLLPIEADPRSVATTAIAVEALLQTLQTATTKNIVLMLDANRSQLGLEYGGFGEETTQLAQERGIAVLLSCRPQQFSHEPLTLRQGIFTTALVAALQEGVTLEQVVEALSDRLPKLSEECWRPRQDLQAVVPPHLRYQILLPEPAQIRGRNFTNPVPSEPGLGANAVGKLALSQPLAFLSRTQAQLKQTVISQLNRTFRPADQMVNRAHPPSLMLVTDAGSATPVSASTPTLESDTLTLSDESFWRRLLLQSGLIGGILLFGVILRNSGALMNPEAPLLNQLPTAIKPVANRPQPMVSSPAAVPTAPSPTVAVEPVLSVEPVLVMQLAQAAFEAQQYEEANRQLGEIPATQRTTEHNQLLEQTNRELINKAKTMLIRPRQMMAENQASDLVEAIKVARLIKPDQPLYQEAQQGIDRWSRIMMDMAQGRAERSNSASVLDAASNYNMAISAARLVPGDQPKVKEQAQQAITLWSQMILDLANEQAAKGDLDLAIQIGEQVPPNTPIYAQALESIANWRNQPLPQQTVEEVAPTEANQEEEEFEVTD